MLSGKIALVTGAGRGIGKAIAIKLASLGATVVVNYSGSKEKAEETVAEIVAAGGSAEAMQCDVSDFKACEELAKAVVAKYGRLDILVNNAGISQIKLFTDTTEEDWDRMMDVNVKGLYNTCHSLISQMIERKYGRIINVSSMWGITGASCEVAYSASKAAVIGFTKALAKELGPSGITVNCVAPGVIDTEMNAGLDRETIETLRNEIPLDRIGSAADVAGAVSFLASEKAGYITGQVIRVDGGIL